MSRRFVEVPASAIRERLAGAGFRLLRPEEAPGHEEVYLRSHDKDPRYAIKVYSSITRGDDVVREVGGDAIRVVALFIPKVQDARRWGVTPKIYPIFKSARVYRTGSVEAVLDRMIERAREAYKVCNNHRKRVA